MDSAALKDSWALVAKSGDEVPLFFYSHLFLSHPDLRSMFPISMSAQRDRLVGALGRIVSNADQVDQVAPFIQQLGRDHRRFAVMTEHYPAVGASLLATLRHFLGPAWNERLATEWAEAYNLIATVMLTAAEQDGGPAFWNAEVLAVERRTLDVAVVQLRPEPGFEFMPGQSFAVEVPQRPRIWRYYSPANAPRPDGTIELHVQMIPGGEVSTAIVRATNAGDTVKIAAPVGERLTLPPDFRSDVVMVAGGTGLAPMRALIEQLDREWHEYGRAPQVHLFHGARVPWNLYEHRLLTQLGDRPWFTYTGAVSDDSSYPGPRGLIGSVAARSQQWRGRAAMVCGSNAMVEHTVRELTTAGMPPEDIRIEQFDDVTRKPLSRTR